MSFGIYLVKKHWLFFLSSSIVSSLAITAIYLALTNNLSLLVTFFFSIVLCIFGVIIIIIIGISLSCLKAYLESEYSNYKRVNK